MNLMNRYSRQVQFKPIGDEGQGMLLNKRVVVVGMGALGTVICNHLVRSGVGHVRMIDRDLVELSNLQRQSLYDEGDVRNHLPKVVAAAKKLRKINSTVTVEPIIADLSAHNAEELLSGFDVIVDGTDNLPTRYLINDVSVKLAIPWVHGAVAASKGLYAVLIPGKTPCYRCLFPNVQMKHGETADTIGIISPIPHIIGSFEAVEVLKLLVGAGHNPNMEQFDVWSHTSFQMDISEGRNQNCPTCVQRQFEFLHSATQKQTSYAVVCGQETVQINPRKTNGIVLSDLAERLEGKGQVVVNPFLLHFTPVKNGITMIFFQDGRVLIHGTNDMAQAKTFYKKYVYGDSND